MDATKNTERAGFDIRVALAAKAKALAPVTRPAPLSSDDERAVADGSDAGRSAADVPLGTPALPTRGGSGFKTLVKRRLRALARAAFKALGPIGRPVGFRLRAYLQSGPQVDARSERDRLNLQHFQFLQAQQLHLNITHDLELLKRSQQEAMERLMTVHTTHVLQEIQSMRETLRRNFSAALRDVARHDQLAPQLARLETYAAATAGRVAIATGSDEVLVRTASGYALCPASDPALLSLLMETGEQERGTRLLIEKLLAPGDTFVDAGANIGLHTLAAGRAMQSNGRVLAFEPMPATCELLRKSVWMNGFSGMVEIHQAAVSNRTGHQSLYLGSTSGHHSLYPLLVSTLSVPAPVDVPLVRIDDVAGARARVDLMKIDVEGAELEALEGATSTIGANPAIALIVEFGLSHLQRSGHSTEQWLAQFASFGFEVKAIDAETGALQDCSVQTLEGSPSVNLLFARPGASAWARARGTP